MDIKLVIFLQQAKRLLFISLQNVLLMDFVLTRQLDFIQVNWVNTALHIKWKYQGNFSSLKNPNKF